MSFEYSQKCSVCPLLKSQHTRRQREVCSRIRKAQYDEWVKSVAYKNERQALIAAKAKAEKANQIPFASIPDKRGKPFRTQFS